MGWTTPKLWTNGEVLTAQDLNIYLRDNFAVCEAAIATTPSSFLVSDGANSLVERKWYTGITKTDDVETLAGDNPASAFHDLATVGPVVTVETGEVAMIIMSMQCYSTKVSTAFNFSHQASAGCKVSGATTISALTSGTVFTNGQGNEATQQFSMVAFFNTLNPGINTFTMQYRCFPDDNDAGFQNRTLIVLPL